MNVKILYKKKKTTKKSEILSLYLNLNDLNISKIYYILSILKIKIVFNRNMCYSFNVKMKSNKLNY